MRRCLRKLSGIATDIEPFESGKLKAAEVFTFELASTSKGSWYINHEQKQKLQNLKCQLCVWYLL